MATWEPDRVMLPVPLPLTIRPLAITGPRLSTPCSTERVVVSLSPSMSLTAMLLLPKMLKTLLPSSARVWVPGVLLIGASLTGVMSNLRVAVLVRLPSLRV